MLGVIFLSHSLLMYSSTMCVTARIFLVILIVHITGSSNLSSRLFPISFCSSMRLRECIYSGKGYIVNKSRLVSSDLGLPTKQASASAAEQ